MSVPPHPPNQINRPPETFANRLLRYNARQREVPRLRFPRPSASSASRAISRDTPRVRGNRPEHPRLGAQLEPHRTPRPPPRATATASSSTIFPGSWIASGRRHGPNRFESSLASLLRRAVSTSSVPPACDTSDSPPTITGSHGLRRLSFTREVLLNSVRSDLGNLDQTVLSRHSRVSGPSVAH